MYTARSVRAKNVQEIFFKKKTVASSRVRKAHCGHREARTARVPEERHRPMIGWNTKTRILKDFWDEMGKTAGCAARASPKVKKHSVACLSRLKEWQRRTIRQSECMTHGTDTELQQDAQAATSTSKDHTSMTDIRDTDKPEHGNDESENPGE